MEVGKPRLVAPVFPETEADRQRFGQAEIRREHRLAKRRAIAAARAARGEREGCA